MALIKEQVVAAARELNRELGLDPRINTRQKMDPIKDLLLEASDLITPEDDISEKTLETIRELKLELGYSLDEEDDLEDEGDDLEDEGDDLEDEGDEEDDLEDEGYPDMSILDDEDPEEDDEDDEDPEEEPEPAPKKKKTSKKEKETPKEKEAPKKEKETPKEKPIPKKKKADSPIKPTKRSVIEACLVEGATLSEMAQKMADMGIDPDFEKNCTTTRLWLRKMGFDTKKGYLSTNPVFKNPTK